MKVGNRELDLDLITQNINNGNIDLISIKDIHVLENIYVGETNPKIYDEIAKVLGLYYGKTGDTQRALSLTELFIMSHKHYKSTVFDYFIENRCEEENIKEYEKLDIPYVHESLIIHYYDIDDTDSILKHINSLQEINNIDACFIASDLLLENEETQIKAIDLVNNLIEYDCNGSLNFILGRIYYEGLGVEIDLRTAKEYFEKGLALGNASSANWLGYMYENGIYVDKSIPEAINIYKKAVEFGDEDSVCYLCDLYIANKEYQKALEFLNDTLKSNESLKGSIYYKLGELYFYGRGVETNYQTALEYFEKAYENEYTVSLAYLGFLYGSNLVEQDTDKAIMCYKEAIEDGRTELLRDLATLYAVKLNDFDNAFACYEELFKHHNEVDNNFFDTAIFEYFNIKCCITKEKEDLEEFRKFLVNLIETRKEKVEESCDVIRLIIDRIDCYLGTKEHYDFINNVNLSIEEHRNSTERMEVIKSMLENNSPVIIINSITELTDEYMSSLPKNSLIYTKNYTELNTFDCYELYTYNEMKEIIKELRELISDIDKDQNEEDIFMQVYIKVLNSITRIEAKKIFQTDPEMHNLCSILTKEAVCMGFSSILSTALEMLGIECERVIALGHQFIETKINNEWYYSDMSFDIRDNTLDNCLKGENDFFTIQNHIPSIYSTHHKTNSSYPNIKELYKKNLIKLYGNDYKEHDVLNILGYQKTKNN